MPDAAPAALLPLLVAREELVAIVATAAALLGLPARVGPILVYGLLAWLLAIAVPVILARAGERAVAVGAVFLSAFTVSVLLGQGSADFYLHIAVGLLIGLGWATVALSVSDYRLCRRYLYASGPVILLAVILESWSTPGGGVDSASYSQSLGYKALPAVLIFFDAAFRGRRIVNIALTIASATLMLSAGARGPLVVAALFVVARVVLHLRASPRTAIITAWIGAVAIWLVARYYLAVLGVLQPALERTGLSTRAVTGLMNGAIFEDRARIMLQDNTLAIVDQHLLTGVGMTNERLILAQSMGGSVESESLGWYPHNIFLELWAQFGVILGTILILLLLRAIFRALIETADLDRRDLVLVFVALGLLPLLFSGSYLSWPPFFGLVGLLLQQQARHDRLPSRRIS